jgi:hypothetical protein
MYCRGSQATFVVIWLIEFGFGHPSTRSHVVEFHTMDTERLLEEVEQEIERLQQVANLLRGDTKLSARGKGRKGQRNLSKAARRAISDAQKARWAKVRAKKA